MKCKGLIILGVTLLIHFSCLSQETIKNVEATLLNYQEKVYGLKDLNLLLYPSVKKIRDTILSQSKSERCKVYLNLKIMSGTNQVVKQRILSDCKFDKRFDYKSFLENDLSISVISMETDKDSVEITIPLNIYEH